MLNPHSLRSLLAVRELFSAGLVSASQRNHSFYTVGHPSLRSRESVIMQRCRLVMSYQAQRSMLKRLGTELESNPSSTYDMTMSDVCPERTMLLVEIQEDLLLRSSPSHLAVGLRRCISQRPNPKGLTGLFACTELLVHNCLCRGTATNNV